jgi:hypothetical protein
VAGDEQALAEDGRGGVSDAGRHRQGDAGDVDAPAAVAGEQQHARGGAAGGERPARAQPLAVDEPAQEPGGGRAGPDRHDGADRNPRELDGREERELVDDDRDGDRQHRGAWPRHPHAERAGDRDEQGAAEDDPRRADRHGRGARADRLDRAGRAEADGGGEDLCLRTEHGASVPQSSGAYKCGWPYTGTPTRRPARAGLRGRADGRADGR